MTNETFRRIDVPLPTERLAQAAKKALQVDQELSPLVRRSFSIIAPAIPSSNAANSLISPAPEQTIFRTEYKATTNRMLRVAVNGFMESLGVVLGIMEELDVDVLEMKAQSGRVDEVG